MRWKRDDTADALYVYVRDAPIDHTEELSDGTIVDVSGTDDLIGVEILAVSRGWNDEALSKRFALSDYDRDVLRAVTHPPQTLHVGHIADVPQNEETSASGASVILSSTQMMSIGA